MNIKHLYTEFQKLQMTFKAVAAELNFLEMAQAIALGLTEGLTCLSPQIPELRNTPAERERTSELKPLSHRKVLYMREIADIYLIPAEY